MSWLKSYKFKYALAGALFGCCFPIIAMGIDIWRLELPLAWETIKAVQLDYPIHLIIDTAPLFLGLFALIGGVLQDKVTQMNQGLREEIATKIEELSSSSEYLKTTTAQKERMENELQIARNIQLSMVPFNFPNEETIILYAQLIPAREVGGDFYDFYYLDKKHLCFMVGDVSGKGMPAALMMSVSKTWLKARSKNDYSTASILNYVNEQMAEDNPNNMFLTLFIGILNIETGELKYSNAGHNPSLVKTSKGKVKVLEDRHGPVIAAFGGLNYTESITWLTEGDILFAYTDGITEAHNTEDELYGQDRLIDKLKKSEHKTPKNIIHEVITDVKLFEVGRASFDDITTLSILYKGAAWLKN